MSDRPVILAVIILSAACGPRSSSPAAAPGEPAVAVPGEPAVAAPGEPAVAAPGEPTVVPTIKPPTASGTWVVAFERTMGWSDKELAVSPRSDLIIADGQKFDAQGQFLGMATMRIDMGDPLSAIHGLLRDGRALAVTAQGFDDTRLVLGSPDKPPLQAEREVDIGGYLGIAISRDETQVAIYRAIGVLWFRLPDLKRIELVKFEMPEELLPWWKVGFSQDGRLLYTAPDCPADAVCEVITVYMRDRKRKVTRLLKTDTGIARAGFSRMGDAAIVHYVDGYLEVVTVPGGRRIGELPVKLKADEYMELAVSAGGKYAALTDCFGLKIFELQANAYVEVFSGKFPGKDEIDNDCTIDARPIEFFNDGTGLVLGGQTLTVLRPASSASAAGAPAVSYPIQLPDGFVAERSTELSLTPQQATGWAYLPAELGVFSRKGVKGKANVSVIARSAEQFAAFKDIAAWGEAVMVRYEASLRKVSDPNRVRPPRAGSLNYRHAWRDRQGRRVVEYGISLRSNCNEPRDRYVRVIESDAHLIHVAIDTSVSPPPDRVRDWLDRFFDAPLNIPPPPQRKLATTGLRPGCK